MEPGNLTQLVKETFVTPVMVVTDALENLAVSEIELLKQPQAEQLHLEGIMEAKDQTKDQAHLSPQGQLEDGTKLSLLPDHQITDATRDKKERTKAQGGKTKAITEAKAIGGVLPHKLAVLKGLNLGQPLGNKPVPSASNKNRKGHLNRLW